jgi:hypothetical protein
MQFGVGRK